MVQQKDHPMEEEVQPELAPEDGLVEVGEQHRAAEKAVEAKEEVDRTG